MKRQTLKVYIIFAIIIYINCRNESYYSQCNYSYYENKDKEKPSVSKCNSYTPVDPENITTNNTCCYLHYKIAYAEVVTYTYYYKEKGINKTILKNNDINNTNHKKKRNLEYLYDHYYACIGLSYEGYKNIKKVIKELESAQSYYFVDELNCFSKYLQFFIINILFKIILILL